MRSCHISFNSFLTVQLYVRQLHILTNQTTALIMCLIIYTARCGRIIPDWSVENMIPNMMIKKMSLDVCGTPLTKKTPYISW